MSEQNLKKRFDVADFSRWVRKWRMIQMASFLPLVVCVSLMLYFREASGFGVVAILLILIVGVFLPEVKADIGLSNLIFREELEELRKEVQRLREDLQDQTREKPPKEQEQPAPPVQ